MRILLIGNYLPDRQESMLRYADLLERELTARGHVVTLLQPPVRAGKLLRGAAGKWLGYLDKLVLFPATLKRALGDIELVHICDQSNSLYVKHLGHTPHLVTCHDVLAIQSALGEVPQNRVSATGRRLQKMILSGLKRAQYIVCISAATQTEMLHVTGRQPAGSTTVLTSLAYAYKPMPRDEAESRLAALGYEPFTPFFLHVGGDGWYKNRLALLRIFDRLYRRPGYAAARLLLVGAALEPALTRYIQRKGHEHRVTQLSGLPNEDLRAAYSLAVGLLFPSLQEGFGWPILEAQACGCPVFATGRAPMTEVGGKAAVYFDPSDPKAAAEIVTDALTHRETMVAGGLQNVQRFSVGAMMDGYLRAYEHVLASD